LKRVNLISLFQSIKNLSEENKIEYLNYLGVTVKSVEVFGLEKLISAMKKAEANLASFNDFYFGYTIPQIGKEFDLLRFGREGIINIELKSEFNEEKIKAQLIRNNYYLSFLGVEIYQFTFVSSESIFYTLAEDGEIITIEPSILIDLLNGQKINNKIILDETFNPSNYLVSPFNSTHEFLENRYFLTNHQELIKKTILKLFESNKAEFVSIIGKAGTGKTLLTYDIAKFFIELGLRVVVIHCGILNHGHYELRDENGWIVLPIKSYWTEINSEFDIVILDEVQRIRPNQLYTIIGRVKDLNAKCIFSYDDQQWLRRSESRNDIKSDIALRTSAKLFTLKEKIRTNKEIASFIIALFNRNKPIVKINRSNIELLYFNKYVDAVYHLDFLKELDWKIINYTPSNRQTLTYDKYRLWGENSTHEVIGQEFDKVVAVIDEHFCFDENGALSTKGHKSTPYYHQAKMLFQIMTRVRRKLIVIVIKNDEIMERCLSILN